MSNKRMVLLLLGLVIISVSGCVVSEKNKAGWDWEKYDKYSKFYDEINKPFPETPNDELNSERYGLKNNSFSVIVRIEDYMVGMPQDTEFDKTWYFTFLYFKRGEEAQRDAEKKAAELRRAEYERGGYRLFEPDYTQARAYYDQAYKYRQKIEEMRLNLSEDGKPKLKHKSSEGEKINIVEFLKFDCSHCYDFHKSLPSLLKKYDGKITITYIPIVWTKQSTKSVEAYIIAEQMGKGEEMKDALFQAKFQKGMDIMESTIAIEDAATGIGLGADFKTKLEGGEARKAALDNIKIMSDYGIQEVPTLIINRNITVDPPTIANLEEVVGSMTNTN